MIRALVVPGERHPGVVSVIMKLRPHPLRALRGDLKLAAIEQTDRRMGRRLLPGSALYAVAGLLLLGTLSSARDTLTPWILGFVGVATALCGLRVLLILRFDALYGRGPDAWRRVIAAISLLLFATWSTVSVSVILLEGLSAAAVLALLISAAIVTGVHSIFAHRMTIAAASYAVVLLPPAIELLLAGIERAALFGVALVLYGVYFVIQTRSRFLEIWDHIITAVRLGASVQELERLNETLQEKEEQALSAAAAKTQFIANTSHELRTPLHGILGNAELLLANGLPERSQQLTRAISSAGRSLLHLVNDILELSRVEAGQIRIDIDARKPRDLIQAVSATASSMADQRGIDLDTYIADDVPELLSMDGERYRQILLNLVSNAVKFTDEGRVRIEVVYHVDEDPPRLETSVTDTGPGIPSSSEAAIFEDFVQLESGPDRRYEGSGLGLAICKRLVDAMDGEMGLETTRGVGSTFWFSIPARVASSIEYRPRSSGRIKTIGERAGSYRARILVVDDNESNLDLAVGQVEHLGHAADAATGAIDAFELLEREKYDLMLLDCQMPDVDGYEVAQRVRAMKDNVNHLVPIIAVTANAMPEERNRCLQAGMDDYVSKPLALNMLQQVIDVWVGGILEDAEEAGDERGAQPATAVDPKRISEFRELARHLGQGALDEVFAAFEAEFATTTGEFEAAHGAADMVRLMSAVEAMERLTSELGLMHVAGMLAEASDAARRGAVDEVPRAGDLRDSASASVAWLRAALKEERQAGPSVVEVTKPG